MFWRISKSVGIELMYDRLFMNPAYSALMRVKWGDGKKLMLLIIMMYDIFSEYHMDINDEVERMRVCGDKLGIGVDGIDGMVEWVEAVKEFRNGNTDVEVSQLRGVEYGISQLLRERDILVSGIGIDKDGLDRIEVITKILKLMFSEREELTEHFINLVKGGIGGGKIVGNKRLGYLASVNDTIRKKGS